MRIHSPRLAQSPPPSPLRCCWPAAGAATPTRPSKTSSPPSSAPSRRRTLRRHHRRPADRGPRQDRAAGAAPAIANPTAPTAAELRTLAIYNNYRALVDIAAGGYGALYGPNIDVNGNHTLGEGKIAGTEYIAYADDGTGQAERDADGADPDHRSTRRRPAS